MGQLQATKVDKWYLDGITPDEIINYVYDGTTRRTMRSTKIQLSISRKFAGMKAFSESIGDVKANFTFNTSAAFEMTYFSTGHKFRCIRDEPVITDTVNGEGLQSQTWLYIGKETEMPAGELDVT